MNKEQIKYSLGSVNDIVRTLFNIASSTELALATKWGYESIKGFSNSDYTKGVSSGLATLIAGISGIATLISVNKTDKYNKKVTSKNENLYPLQTTEKITIQDEKGLEFLLLNTSFEKNKEWATAVESHYEEGKAVITKIGTYEDNKECFADQGKTGMSLYPEKLEKRGYNGYSHYHPFGSGMNYNTNKPDKNSCSEDGINLLTFNMPWGPEIIGYNQRYVYISTNESKTEFAKANRKEIRNYLGKPRKKKEKMKFPVLVPNELRPYFA